MSSSRPHPAPEDIHPHERVDSRDARTAEAKLLLAARQGSTVALDALLERLAEHLGAELGGRRRPRGLGPSRGFSDLVQDTLLKVREKFELFDRDSFDDFTQWARTILFRRWQECSRNHRTRTSDSLKRRFIASLEARLSAQRRRERPDQVAEFVQDSTRVYALYESLPRHERNIIRLRLMEGLRYSEIAALTGISAEGTRTAYRRAIIHLRLLFETPANDSSAP